MKNRLKQNPILPIFLIVFTNILGAGVIIPILPLYAKGEFGATDIQATLLASAYFGAQFIAAPWLGNLSDKFGRRPVLLISQLGTVFSFILFIFAPEIGALLGGPDLAIGISGGLLIVFSARILDGITGGNITTAQAYISDISTPENRTQALGMISAAFGAGFILGPAFGGLLSDISVRAPFIGAALITTGTFILTALILDESLPPERRGKSGSRSNRMSLVEIRQISTLPILLMFGFFIMLAFSSLQSTFSLYADAVLFSGVVDTGRVARNIGLMLAFLGVVNVITQMSLLRPLVKRFGEQTLLVIGQFTLFLAFFLLPFFPTALGTTLLMAPLAFGRGITDPSAQSLVTRFGSDENRGQLLGTYQSAVSLGTIIGPMWSGFVFQNISPRATFWVASALLVPAVILALRLRSRPIPTIPSPQPAN